MLAFLAAANTPLSLACKAIAAQQPVTAQSVFCPLALPAAHDTKRILLDRLTDIHAAGWHSAIRLNKAGQPVPYHAKNGGGYTLEALLGIRPNGRAEPDFLGWELKAYGSDRITLMTPEPDGGFYGEQGVRAFVTRFGKPAKEPHTHYFTGTHRAHVRQASTGLTLVLQGFDAKMQAIEGTRGAIELQTDQGECVAAWSFARLMLSWNKKHAQAAYVPYESDKAALPTYRYLSPILLGEGTDFVRYLSALAAGLVVFDPGSKITLNPVTQQSNVKARSQFRMPLKHLGMLYRQFEAIPL